MQRTLPAGFIAPCLPTKTNKLPSGSLSLHEIKHDGFRIIARKDGPRVRLYSRPGNDLSRRFPLIVETLASLRSRSCIIDGEAVPYKKKVRVNGWRLLQIFGAACLAVVILTHVAERFDLFPSMGMGPAA